MENNNKYLESFLESLEEEREKSELNGKTFKRPLKDSFNQYRSAWNRLTKTVATNHDIISVKPSTIDKFMIDNPTINVHLIRPVLIHAVRNNVNSAYDKATKDMIRWLL